MAVEVVDVVKCFGSTKALDGVSFRVEEGSIHAIVGPNGAGKTTLFRIVVGVLKPDKGNVYVYGHPVHEYVKKFVGYVSESLGLYNDLSVEENLMRFCLARGFSKNTCYAEIRRVLELFELDEVRDRKVSSLSAGTRQRVSIARAFISNPQLMVLDEPTNNLDILWREKLWRYLRDFVESGGTVLFSTHILSEVEEVANEVTLLVNGRIVASGSIEEIVRIARSKRCVRIRSTDSVELYNLLRKHGYSAKLAPDYVEVLVDDEELNEVLNTISMHGIKVLSIDARPRLYEILQRFVR